VVGAQNEDAQGSNAGAIYVYKQNFNGTWIQVAKLTADGSTAFDRLGFDVAADANTVMAGAIGDEGQASAAGAAYFFTDGSSTGTRTNMSRQLVAPTQAPILALEAPALQLSPTPAGRPLQVRTTGFAAEARIAIYNMQGRLLHTGSLANSQANSVQSVDLGTLQPGLYLLRITDGQHQLSKRFIKK